MYFFYSHKVQIKNKLPIEGQKNAQLQKYID